jgi:hypothetical protein
MIIDTARYAAIVGGFASSLTRGDLVHVQGCVLHRNRYPLLVVSYLRRIARQDQWVVGLRGTHGIPPEE